MSRARDDGDAKSGVPTLYLMCGMPGAGKSTAAARLVAKHSALLLSPDEWIARLASDSDGHDDALRDRVLAAQFDEALKTLRAGQSVVWDHGCWTRAERDAVRVAAEAVGAGYELWWLDTPVDEIKRRLVTRNAAGGGFVVTPEHIDAWWPQFETPLPDEPGLVRVAA